MVFESFINHVEGLEINYWERWLSPSWPKSADKIALTSGTSMRPEVLSEVVVSGGIVGHIFLSRRIIVGQISPGIIFYFLSSACECGRFLQCGYAISVFICELVNNRINRPHCYKCFCCQPFTLESQDHLSY